MKKVFLFCLLSASISCSMSLETESESIPDEEDQSSIQYLYADFTETKVLIGADERSLSWANGDVITVKGTDVDGNQNSTAYFKINSDADAEIGKFSWYSGAKLSVVSSAVKYNTGWVDFATQQYNIGEFPAFIEASATEGNKLHFVHPCSYVKLSFTGSGIINKITMDSPDLAGTDKNVIAVSIPEGLLLSESPSSVYFVVPLVENIDADFKFYDNEGGVMTARKTGLTSVAGTVHIFPSIEFSPQEYIYPGSDLCSVTVSQMVGTEQKKVVWAPVNCGYSEDHPNGLHYQWGRLTGFPYYPAKSADLSELGYSVEDGPVEVPVDNVFYKIDGDWRTPSLESSWPSDPADVGYLEGKLANPCPKGWRIPTYDELNGLCTGNFVSHTGSWGVQTSSDPVEAEKIVVNPGGYFAGLGIAEEDKTTSVFFALTGQRTGATGGSFYRAADGWGRFWSSETVTGDSRKAHLFNVKATKKDEATGLRSVFPEMTETAKAVGASVRCVKE